jgi:hypothetical protein
MRPFLVFFILIILLLQTSFATDENKEFKLSGSPFVKVFTNFNNKLNDGKNTSAFEIKRAYLGYKFKMSKAFSGKVTLDFGNPEDGGKLELTAYLKHAYVQYKKGNLIAKFGMIATSSFKIQEKFWGGRYLFKSFQDEYKYGPSADQGISVLYKIHDIISIDMSVLNGEGYKNLEVDDIRKYTVGLTLTPLSGIMFRAYYDEMGNSIKQKTMSFFASYKFEEFKIGAEYNLQANHKNVDGSDIEGMSFYGGYDLDFMRVFARYDKLSSKNDWNTEKDGSAIIVGAEFSPVKGFKITPNYQGWTPKQDGAKLTHGMYLNCEIKF